MNLENSGVNGLETGDPLENVSKESNTEISLPVQEMINLTRAVTGEAFNEVQSNEKRFLAMGDSEALQEANDAGELYTGYVADEGKKVREQIKALDGAGVAKKSNTVKVEVVKFLPRVFTHLNDGTAILGNKRDGKNFPKEEVLGGVPNENMVAQIQEGISETSSQIEVEDTETIKKQEVVFQVGDSLVNAFDALVARKAVGTALEEKRAEEEEEKQKQKEAEAEIKKQLNVDALKQMAEENLRVGTTLEKKQTKKEQKQAQKENASTSKYNILPSEIFKLKSPDLRNRFQKLADGVKRFIVKNIWNPPVFIMKALFGKAEQKVLLAKEKIMRLEPGYRIGALFNTALMARQESGWLREKGSLVDLSARYEAGQKEIDALQAHLNERENEILKQENEYGPLSDADHLRLGIEKTRFERQLNNAISRQDVVRSKLETASNIHKIHENTRKVLANELIDKLDLNIKPYEARLESFKSKREKLTNVIKQFSDVVAEKENKLQELDKETEDDPLSKITYKLFRKNIVSTLKRGREKIADVESERRDIDNRMTLINERLQPWLDMRNKYAALTQESAVNYDAPKGRSVFPNQDPKLFNF